jgi:large subunit ribosomal protein L18
MKTQEKQRLATLRHLRVRKKISGTPERPRMSVTFTGKHIYVQFVDDLNRVTLASASSRHKTTPDREKLKANVASAASIGKLAAAAAKDKGISAVVFDRGSACYHGKVKAVADAAREAGLKF